MDFIRSHSEAYHVYYGFHGILFYLEVYQHFKGFQVIQVKTRQFKVILGNSRWILGDFKGIGEIPRDVKVCQGKSWYFKQFHAFTRDFTWRYTQVQVYQVYWGFPGNLLDFKEFQEI